VAFFASFLATKKEERVTGLMPRLLHYISPQQEKTKEGSHDAPNMPIARKMPQFSKR